MSSYLREIARRGAQLASAPIEVISGRGERLPPMEGTFDVAVASLVLCSVSDPSAALHEVHRVLRPGAQLRFIDHGDRCRLPSPHAWVGAGGLN